MASAAEATPKQTAAASAKPGMTVKARALRLSRDLSAPWPRHQWRNGSFHERLGTSRYGDAVLGYGLLQAGARDRNRRLVLSGLRGVNASIRKREPGDIRDFKSWAVAASYNLVRKRLGHLAQARGALARWRPWLADRRTTHLFGRYENKSLVDAIGVLEMRRTGIASEMSSRRSHEAAKRLVNRRIPAMVSSFVLSDPAGGGSPTAYHALSAAFYGRGVRLLGRAGSRRARATLLQLVHTASLATAPDGDFAVWGRSMQQKWTLTGLAAGEAIAARMRGSGRSTDRHLHALADRQLRRAAGYGVGPAGEWIAPVLRQDFRAGRRGIDRYARTTEYTGLSLVFANWAGAVLPRRRATARIPSDRNMAAQIGQSFARQASVRHGNVWFAVRQHARSDLRHDFGLQALKRLANGRWQDVVPLRPMGDGSAGPKLVTAHRSPFASGQRMRVNPRTGAVDIAGGFRRKRRWLRRGVRFRIAPDTCNASGIPRNAGVSVTVNARAGDGLRFSAFFRRVPASRSAHGVWSTRTGRNPARPLNQAAVFNVPIRGIHWQRGYHSAAEAHLVQGRFSVIAPQDGVVKMTLC